MALLLGLLGAGNGNLASATTLMMGYPRKNKLGYYLCILCQKHILCRHYISRETIMFTMKTRSKRVRFHLDCFANCVRECNIPASAEAIQGYWLLSKEDRALTRGKLPAASERIPGAIEDAEEESSADESGIYGTGRANGFTCEYAKSGRSVCVECEQRIAQYEVRIGEHALTTFKYEIAVPGGYFRWYHVDCFSSRRHNLNFWNSGKEIPGYNALDEKHMKILRRKLPAVNRYQLQGL